MLAERSAAPRPAARATADKNKLEAARDAALAVKAAREEDLGRSAAPGW